MSEYRVGEIVDITIKGARVIDTTGTHPPTVHFTVPTGQNVSWSMPLDHKQITVERSAPTSWPPQQSDVWRDRWGGHWFAYYLGGITMVGQGGSQVRADLLLETGAPLTLVYRRESDGGQS